MRYRLNLTGKNSNEIYTISLPQNLIGFLGYDFTAFMERCNDLCRFFLKTGKYRQDEVVEVRNSISPCHKYYEYNMRTVFDKIVIDCWIEYLCRQNEIGIVALWNSYIHCRNDFEKAVFTRLNEYRHNRAHNQWVNILKIQEYATRKAEFVFGKKVRNSAEASAKVGYFDLMFNVTSNEMGFDLSEMPENVVSIVGRTPNSPFTMSNVSREIIRNVLADMPDNADKKPSSKRAPALFDQTAMDAFTEIKAFLPDEPDSIINTLIKSMGEAQKVYVPGGFKAVIDLEFDALTEFGGVMQKCLNCGEYYLKDESYQYDYCDRAVRGVESCIDKMGIKSQTTRIAAPVQAVDTALVNERCDLLYREMSERVNVDLTQRDFSDWYKFLTAIRENLLNGMATMKDFDSFVEYSKSISFTPIKQKPEAEPTPVEIDEKGREVRPFVFEKIDRKELSEHDSLLYETPKETSQPFPVKTFRKADVTPFDEERKFDTDDSLDDLKALLSGASKSSPMPSAIGGSLSASGGSSSATGGSPSATGGSPGGFFQAKVIRVPTPVENENEVTLVPGVKPVLVQGFSGKDLYDEEPEIQPPLKNKPVQPDRATLSQTSKDIPPQTDSDVKIYEPAAPMKLYERATQKKHISHLPLEGQSPSRLPAADISSTQQPRERVASVYNDEYAPLKTISVDDLRGGKSKESPETRAQYAVSSYKSASQAPFISPHGDFSFGTSIEDGESLSRSIPYPTQERSAKEVRFNDFLDGFGRGDGFPNKKDSEEPPQSHKTQRVMDALFKPSKPSLSLNVKNRE
ncbi:MAG: hypothetical protein FWH05_04245 [Oscillospiraceae bacterium]|nr:hypothetical protein [Oscillospiraceae bacterium]